MNPVLFYDMFPFLRGNKTLVADYNAARVDSVVVDKAKTTMSLTLTLTEPTPPYEIREIERLIAKEFCIESVLITAFFSHLAAKHTDEAEPNQILNKEVKTKSLNKVILGKDIKTKPTPIKDITLDDGRVTVVGEVCLVLSEEKAKSGAWALDFDLTDYNGTINIYKFMLEKGADKIVNKIKTGMWLKISGNLFIRRKTGDIALDPTNIIITEREEKHDTACDKRVELHLHTQMSAHDAITDINDIISRAVKWGHPAIAITDHGVVQAFPYAHSAASKHGDKIKIIYGLEGYFINDDVSANIGSGTDGGRSRNRHIILLAKNKIGLNNLYKLVTKSHTEHFNRFPIISKSLLTKHREGLIVGSACEAGELFSAVVNKQDDDTLKQIAEFYDYLEIQPICNNNFLIYGKNPQASNDDHLRDFNRRIVELGKSIGKPVVATGDVHFIDPEHEVFRQILLTSKEFQGARDELPIYFKTTDEMINEFSYLGEDVAYEVVVKNSNMIADMCENISPLPPAKKLYPPRLENSAKILSDLVLTNLTRLYGDNPPKVVVDLLETEMNDILSRNYDVIYVAAQKLVADSLQNGYIVGSRGSVGSSVVAYFMGITEVNALPAHYRCEKCCTSDFESGSGYSCGADMPDANCPKCGELYVKDGFNIPFETFLGFDGDKVPDIDLNFSSDWQAKAHDLTRQLFGAENVYRVGIINTIQERTAFGYVKKYLEETKESVTRAEENRLSRGCVGVKRTTGKHSGGLIVIPQNSAITDFSPVQYPADDSGQNIITTHFEYKFLEDNLIKIDALGHDDPTMLKMLEDMTGVKVTDIKLDDEGTLSIFRSPLPLGLPDNDNIIGKTGTIGISEFGTTLTKEMLTDTKPDNFDTLVRLSGFAHGELVWKGNARELIMSGTAGVGETISCRDDIMLFLISKGIESREAFSISETVRKGKGLSVEAEEKMIKHGIPAWYIESCKKIKYLFPKAHAVAYVMMAFRIAWYKLNRPLAFYSAYFYRRSQLNAFDANLMIRGINIVKAKVKEIKNIPPPQRGKNESLLITLEACYEFYLRGYEFTNIDIFDSDPTKFIILDDKKLRPPLVAVNGLGETTAFDIADKREKEEFLSIEDIAISCKKLTKSNIEQLKLLDALRNLPETNQYTMF